MSQIVLPQSQISYLSDGVSLAKLAADDGPQADRDPLHDLDHGLLLPRRIGGGADPLQPDRARRHDPVSRDLQPAVHHARHHHGVVLPGARRAGHHRQLRGPADAGRARPGVPEAQPAELVSVHGRRHLRAVCLVLRRRRHRLDILHAAVQQLCTGPCRRGGRSASSSPASPPLPPG